MGKNYKSNNIPQIKIGETIISDNLMIVEGLFVSIGPKLSDEFDHVTLDFPENLATGPESLFTLSEISKYEVFQLLNDLKISNSTGIDSMMILRYFHLLKTVKNLMLI